MSSVVDVVEYRPTADEPFMNQRQREYFRAKLNGWKEDILRERLPPECMNFLELKKYIQTLQKAGESPYSIDKMRADLHYKVSLPFIILLATIFAVSLTVKVGRQGVAKVFGIGENAASIPV